MLNFAIGNTEYKAPVTWADITLEKGIALAILAANEIPQRLREYWEVMSKLNGKDGDEAIKKEMLEFEMSITEEENFKEFPLFFGKVMELLTTCPKEIIDFIDPMHRNIFFHNHLKEFTWGVLFMPYNFERKPFASFKVSGVEYFMPHDENILGTVRPLGDGTTAIEFAESSDLLAFSAKERGGKFSAMPNLISILCRPMGEKYDEKKSMERAELFKKELNMAQAWEVFFCFNEQLNLLQLRFQISSLEGQRVRQKLRMIIPGYRRSGGLVTSLKLQSTPRRSKKRRK